MILVSLFGGSAPLWPDAQGAQDSHVATDVHKIARIKTEDRGAAQFVYFRLDHPRPTYFGMRVPVDKFGLADGDGYRVVIAGEQFVYRDQDGFTFQKCEPKKAGAVSQMNYCPDLREAKAFPVSEQTALAGARISDAYELLRKMGKLRADQKPDFVAFNALDAKLRAYLDAEKGVRANSHAEFQISAFVRDLALRRAALKDNHQCGTLNSGADLNQLCCVSTAGNAANSGDNSEIPNWLSDWCPQNNLSQGDACKLHPTDRQATGSSWFCSPSRTPPPNVEGQLSAPPQSGSAIVTPSSPPPPPSE